MADLKRLTSNCTKKTQTKYLTRGSPPYSASDCKTMKKKGNDGNFYVSTADKNGTYKWTKAATNKIKAKATARAKAKAKTVKAKPTSEITMAEIQDIIKRNGMIKTGTKKELANSIYSVYKIGKEYGTRKIKITQKEKNKIESFLFGL
jgi:hypothetical protein